MILNKQYNQINLKCFCILIGYFLFNFTVIAQNIRISEVVSSNSSHVDEDGDTPDWLELHNYGTTPVSLLNWGLTDDGEKLHDWQFPEITLNPDEYLLVWASDKDREELSFSRTLVNEGDVHNYILPTRELSSNWNNVDFNDSTWDEGPSGFGFNDDDDATEVPKGTISVYTRINFTMPSLSILNELILDMDYDDAFVAYINGVEVARANIDGVPPDYGDTANNYIDARIVNGSDPERFKIDNASDILNEGAENVLAIQLHNFSEESSDLSLIPFLSATFSEDITLGITPPEILNLTDGKFHTNFKISSSSDELFLSDANQNIIDQVLVEDLPSNTSLGFSKTSNTLVNYIETTPGFENSNVEFAGAITSDVVFSNEGGILDNAITLTLSGNSAGQTIRYTTDSSEPTENDTAFTGPIAINRNTVVRARIFGQNLIPTPTYTRSFVFNVDHEIDVILITVDSDDFFDEDTGLYSLGPDGTYETNEPNFGANFWENKELPAHFSFHEGGSDVAAVEYNAGIKIFGGWSRANDQRSLSFSARSVYGASEFEYPFFDELSYDKFQSFVLRNSGNDWLKSSIKDIALTSLMRGSDLEFQEYNPVAAYINGEYWGLYRMREKNSEHMLASKHNLDADDITVLEKNAEVNEGSNEEYKSLIDYVSNTDLSIDENFKYVTDRIDVENYALYQATNIFFNNTDWPGNNIRYWKHTNGKWRWILYDTDFGFGLFWDTDNYDYDTLEYALADEKTGITNPPWATLLFRSLTTNIGFRNLFINRYADELNTRFSSDNVKNHIDNTALTVASELERNHQRWGGSVNDAAFFTGKMKDFAEARPGFAKDHILSEFDLPGFHSITIDNDDNSKGFVRFNDNLEIKESTWTGDYFETVPVELKAVPEAGYMFSHWSGDISSTENVISVNLSAATSITPNFIEAENKSIVISEINYKSSDALDSDDWVELYNPNPFAVDISDWKLKDSDDSQEFSIPAGTEIKGEAYIVLVKDTDDFKSIFPGVNEFVGDIDFGFGGEDSVRLFTDSNELEDEVNYTDSAPWPDCPNGSGQTLELISPELDNSLPESWSCVSSNGSPNALNIFTVKTVDVVIDNTDNTTILEVEEIENLPVKIYPNPVSSVLYFTGEPSDLISVEVTNVLGQRIMSVENPGNKINMEGLQIGVYFIKMKTKNDDFIYKFVKD